MRLGNMAFLGLGIGPYWAHRLSQFWDVSFTVSSQQQANVQRLLGGLADS